MGWIIGGVVVVVAVCVVIWSALVVASDMDDRMGLD